MRFHLILLFFCTSASRVFAIPKWAMVQIPVADVRSSTSVPLSTTTAYDSYQETQILYGETVQIMGASDPWYKIEAPEQQEFSHENRWQGYPGWIKQEAVRTLKKPLNLNFIVRKKMARLFTKPNTHCPYLPLSMGTKVLCKNVQKNGFWKIKKIDGKTGWILEDEIRLLTPPLPEKFSRKLVVNSAFQLLGDPYFWGGRSAQIPELKNQVTAVDCSGLTHLAYRVAGIEIPRDAYEQYLKARKIKKNELKMGDLIFSASKETPGKVSHVAIFLDPSSILEAPQTGQRVRRIEFEKKYGVPFETFKEDEPLGDRWIYFGTYFESNSDH